jgi:hypothetical protein
VWLLDPTTAPGTRHAHAHECVLVNAQPGAAILAHRSTEIAIGGTSASERQTTSSLACQVSSRPNAI